MGRIILRENFFFEGIAKYVTTTSNLPEVNYSLKKF